MTVTYDEIRDWHEAGDDAATIVSKFNAQGLTVRDIDLGELLFTMNFNGMLTKVVGGTTETWTGSVLDMKAAVAGDTTATTSINRWLSHITNHRNVRWETTNPEYSAPFYALYQAFNNPPNESVFNVGDLDAIYALGGGRRETTEAEVQLSIDSQSVGAMRSGWQVRFDAAINKTGTAEQADGVADLRAIADEMEAA